jgi:hypothetical protein
MHMGVSLENWRRGELFFYAKQGWRTNQSYQDGR